MDPLVGLSLNHVILLHKKFLPFDWLRAEVFQLNLKYLRVKITVTMVTPNQQISRRTSYTIIAERFLDLKSGDSRTKRKFGKPKY